MIVVVEGDRRHTHGGGRAEMTAMIADKGDAFRRFAKPGRRRRVTLRLGLRVSDLNGGQDEEEPAAKAQSGQVPLEFGGG